MMNNNVTNEDTANRILPAQSSRNTSRYKDERRLPISVTWLLLTIIMTASISIGACAFLLPDRHPTVLASAREITSAPVTTQQYDAKRQITVVPTMSASRKVLINASGTVTADYSDGGLHSGKAALDVDGHPIVALATNTPLYRDLALGDEGGDVYALNAELARLGYNTNADSNQYSTLTHWAIIALFNNLGVRSDGTLPLVNTIWIPQTNVNVAKWEAVKGTIVAAGSPIAEIPGAITSLSVKNGSPSSVDQTITVFGQQGILKAGSTVVDDPEFCSRVTASQEFAWAQQGDLSQGVDATVTLNQPIEVLRVPAAAVFGVTDNRGCIVSEGKTLPVTIVGADLGVSLIQLADGGSSADGQPADRQSTEGHSNGDQPGTSQSDGSSADGQPADGQSGSNTTSSSQQPSTPRAMPSQVSLGSAIAGASCS